VRPAKWKVKGEGEGRRCLWRLRVSQCLCLVTKDH